MQTPLWSSAPLPPGPMRTVDLFPAMLDWLGLPAPAVMDGDARWRPRTSPEQPAADVLVPSGEFSAAAVRRR
jgi:hypothetical protein